MSVEESIKEDNDVQDKFTLSEFSNNYSFNILNSAISKVKFLFQEDRA